MGASRWHATGQQMEYLMTGTRSHGSLVAENPERLMFLEGLNDCAIFTLDSAGQVTNWNRGAERMLGYPANEVIGSHFARFFPPELARQGKPEEDLEDVAESGQIEREAWLIRHDGSRFWCREVMSALRDGHGELQGFATVLRDITDRKQLSDELHRHAEALAETNRRKDEFLTMLSHELRNPLAPVLNAVHILRQPNIDAQAVRDASTVIERQVRHMAHFIDDLLEVTRGTRGEIILHRETVDVNALVRRRVESMASLLNERRHEVTLSLPPDPLWADVDPARFDQILLNLLYNAAVYTDPGGRIWLTCERLGADLVLRVRDNGIGIAADMLPRIFELFTQADQSLDRKRGGLGIGLTLVRSLVLLHGGRITAQSEGLGKGSEFVIRIPHSVSPRTIRSPTGPSTAGRRPPRVLVVDDNVDMATSLAILLRLYGYEVDVAHDGPAAIDFAAQHRPQVVLLDIGLPGLDGYEVARQLRRLPGGEDSTLVAITGYGFDADRERSRQAGFDHHLVKPIDPEHLERLLADSAATSH